MNIAPEPQELEEVSVTTFYDTKDNVVYVMKFEGDEFSTNFFQQIREEKPAGVRIIITQPNQESIEYVFLD